MLGCLVSGAAPLEISVLIMLRVAAIIASLLVIGPLVLCVLHKQYQGS